MKTRIFLVLALLCAAAGLYAVAEQFTVDGVEANRKLSVTAPEFCWSRDGFSIPTLTNWQLEVDDDPNFVYIQRGDPNAPYASPPDANSPDFVTWFWDSGPRNKGGGFNSPAFSCNGTQGATGIGGANNPEPPCRSMLSIEDYYLSAGACKPVNLGRYFNIDRRADLTYWRVRYQVSSVWQPWIYPAPIMMNHWPRAPVAFMVSDNLEPSTATGSQIALTAGATYYVDPNTGVNTRTKAQAADPNTPWKSLQTCALNVLAGDTCKLAAGNYQGPTMSNLSYQSGTAGMPITVAPTDPNIYPVVYNPTSTDAMSMVNMDGWIWDHMSFDGTINANRTRLVYIENSGVVIKNSTFGTVITTNNSVSSTSDGIVISNGPSAEGRQVVIGPGNTFDKYVHSQILISSGDPLIYGNTFTKCNFTCIEMNGLRGKSPSIVDNRFLEMSPRQGAIQAYLGSPGTRIQNNIFYDIDPNGANIPPGFTRSDVHAWGVSAMRSGQLVADNNTFIRVGWSNFDPNAAWNQHDLNPYDAAAIQLYEMTSYGEYVSNAFWIDGMSIAFVGGSGLSHNTAARGTLRDYNLVVKPFGMVTIQTLSYYICNRWEAADDGIAYCNLVGGVGIPNQQEGAASPTIDPNSVFASFDPNAVNFLVPKAADPNRAFNITDVGNPYAPVPVGGGTREDIGAREYGADPNSRYEYQAMFTVTDQTPMFSWALDDVDNTLDAENHAKYLSGGDVQQALQVQIDTSRFYDSIGGRPIFDSGVIFSSVENYTLPEAAALLPGSYYARVRQWDDPFDKAGAWSDLRVRFTVANDPTDHTGGNREKPVKRDQ